MRCIIPLCLLFVFNSAYAQNTTTHSFSLKKTPAALNDKISYIKVIDKRHFKDNLGYIYDYSTRKKNLVTDSSLDVALSKFANAHFISNKDGSDTLLFIIHGMYLEHKPINADIGTIYLHADFFRGNNGQYKQLFQIDSFGIISKGNMPRIIMSRLDDLIAYNFIKAHKDSLYISSSATYSETEAINLPDMVRAKLPVYQTRQYKKGIYLNWQEFITQTPSITNFKVVEWEEFSKIKPGIYLTDKNGELGERIKLDSYYALYDSNWFKNEDNEAPEIKFINNDFYVSIKVATKKDNKIIKKIMPSLDIKPITEGMDNSSYGGVVDKYLASFKIVAKLDYKTGNLIPVKLIF
jgi:hypothetical protein